MVVTDSRTLEIRVQAKDLVTAQLSTIGRSIGQVGELVKKAMGQVAIGALREVGAAITNLPRQFIAFGRELLQEADHAQKMAAALGTTTESLTALGFAAQQAGVEQGELETASRSLIKAIGEARDGSAKQVRAFADLGISSVTLRDQNLDLVEVYAQVADAIKGIKDPVERTRLLLDLFGKSGNQVANLLAEGGRGIRALAADAKTLGAVLDGDLIAKADAAGDELNRLNVTIKGVFREALRTVLPQFTENVRTTIEFLKANRQEIVSFFQSMASVIVKAMDVAGRALLSIADFFARSFHGWKILLAEFQLGVAKVNSASGGIFGGLAGAAAGNSSEQVENARANLDELLKAKPDVGSLSAIYDRLVEDLRHIGDDGWQTVFDGPKAAKGLGTVNSELIRSKTVLQGAREGLDQFAAEAQDGAALARTAVFQGLGALRDFGTGVILTLTDGANSFAANMRKVTAEFLRLIAQIAANRTATALIGAILPAAGGAPGATSSGFGGGGGLQALGGGIGPSSSDAGARAFASKNRKVLGSAVAHAIRREKRLRDGFGVR